MSVEIRCNDCGVLYGVMDGEVLTIKYRDLFRYIKGGTVTGPCRGCKSTVEWPGRHLEKRSDDQTTR